MRSIILISFIGLSTISFSQKRIIKQAAAFEASDLHEQAAEKYMEALHQNATRPESINGLKRTSQKVVDQKLSEYFVSRNSSNPELAITQFEAVISYRDRLSYFGMTPDIPNYYFEDYESDRQLFSSNLKNQIKDAIEAGSDSKVNELIKKLQQYDPNYNIEELSMIESRTKAESLYAAAVSDFESRNWLSAWKGFTEVEKLEGSYKETLRYKKEIRAKGTTLSIVLPKRNRFSNAELFKSNIIAEVSQLGNPLIQIIDRENLDQVIEEQKLGISGLIDERSAAALGKILGVKAMMLIKVLNYNQIEGSLSKVEKTAYAKSSHTYQGEFRSVPYTEYSQTNKVLVSIQYQLISTETAEVLSADILQKEYADELIYAETATDYNTLYPGVNGYIYKSGSEREKFLHFFTTKRTSKSIDELDFEIQGLLAKQVATSLNSYFSK
ncbi:MAG: CsgG/HfaB family protein [Cyclobacteriaceae bacterium]